MVWIKIMGNRMTQAVVVGVWLLCKVVMSIHPINKGKTELNTRKNQTNHQNQSTTLPNQPHKNVGVRRGSRGLDRKLGRCIGHWVNGVGEKKKSPRGQRGYERNGFNIVNYGSRDW